MNPIKAPDFELDKEQIEKYEKLVAYFEDYISKEVPVNDQHNVTTHPLIEDELAWLTKECFQIFKSHKMEGGCCYQENRGHYHLEKDIRGR